MADDLERHAALSETIEPLPGGLAELRRRLARPRRLWPVGAPSSRPRGRLGLGVAIACAAALAVWLLRAPPRPVADRDALRRLLVDAHGLPHPVAVELGLIGRAAPVVAADPRIAATDTAVFFWVPPAER